MIVSIDELASLREKHKGRKIVFCAGVFDLTHAGHALFFEDCKKYGDILVVMIATDFNVRLYKGEDRPISNEHVRLKMVDSLKAVDYTHLDIDMPDKNFLAVISDVVFKTLKPDFYVINVDAFDMSRRYELVKGTETKLIILDRVCPPEFGDISTSGIIKKIKDLGK
jgi:cytidyltransferase-like protein